MGEILHAATRRWAALIVGTLVILVAIIIASTGGAKNKPISSRPTTGLGTAAEAAAVVGRPTVRPPKFRVYRSKLDEGTSVVVASSTTDEQLKSLLWLFREKVRSHRFKDIGISQPTSMQWGEKGYLSGIIAVYRGKKCANELFSDAPGVGPCGPGEHSIAGYQWGILVDGVSTPDADYASMDASNGTVIKVFDYNDHWQLPADLQGGVDAENQAQAQSDEALKLARKVFADELQRKLYASGFEVTTRVGDERSEELVLNSEMFKDTAARVEFLGSVLPKWRRDLCSVGFLKVRLRAGGLLSVGDSYSVGCK